MKGKIKKFKDLNISLKILAYLCYSIVESVEKIQKVKKSCKGNERKNNVLIKMCGLR